MNIAQEISNAVRLAAHAHRNQKRRTIGGAYISHPIRVAYQAALLGLDHYGVAAAYLHDVVEDTEMTLEHLRIEGISERTLHIVQLLTKWWPDSQEMEAVEVHKPKYYGAIMQDKDALAIKILDRADNLADMAYMVELGKDVKWAGKYLAKSEREFMPLLDANTAYATANGLFWAQAAMVRQALNDYPQRFPQGV